MALENIQLPDHDLSQLCRAYDVLSGDTLGVKLSELVGHPIDIDAAALPDKIRLATQATAHRAVETALVHALSTDHTARRLPGRWTPGPSSTYPELTLAARKGFPGLDLPALVTASLREVASRAREELDDLADPRTRLQSLAVFALNGAGRRSYRIDPPYLESKEEIDGLVHWLGEYAGPRTGDELTAIRGLREYTRFYWFVAEPLAHAAVQVVAACRSRALPTARTWAPPPRPWSASEVFVAHFSELAWAHFVVRRVERSLGLAATAEALRELGS